MKQTMIETGSTNYKRMGKNIYKVGNRYRVRVAGTSLYCEKLKDARHYRELLQNNSNKF